MEKTKGEHKKRTFMASKGSKFLTYPSAVIAPKRQLGQNFLIDKNIVSKIIKACDLKPSDTVLEIGAGLGALTKEIAPRVKKLIAIETDKRLYKELVEKSTACNTRFILADFLKFDITTLPKDLKVIGNLPYYICSPIIAKILENKEHFTSLFITVQLELGKRMIAKINSKDYSAFTIFVQYHSDCCMLFKIKNNAFRPIPKVQSCFMRFEIREKPIFAPTNPALLWKIIHQAFGQRRKTIANTLSKIIPKDELLSILAGLEINPCSRAENLRIKDFVAMADAIDLRIQNEKK